MKRITNHLLVLVIALSMFSCSSENTPSTRRQMGGSIQVGPLMLAGNVSTFAGKFGFFVMSDGTGTAAYFEQPSNITTDGTNLYVTDQTAHVIRKIVISTREVTTLAGTVDVDGSADGIGTGASFNRPAGITTDGTDLYVADSWNNTIRKIVISTGQVTTLAGTAGMAGSADGIGADAMFNSPYGITTNGTNLYVCDSGNSTIRKIIIRTGQVSTLAGSAGIVGFTDGTGPAAHFGHPSDITTDGSALFIADQINHIIRKIDIVTSDVTTLAGSAGVSGSADGIGSSASFNWPMGVTTDGTNLYIADTDNSTIRKIVIQTGAVSTVAGSPGSAGLIDGNSSTARFGSPTGITSDGSRLYVVDFNTIREIR